MNTQKRKILYISGTRADYGLMRKTLLLISRQPGMSLTVAATGMHLMPEFGMSVKQIIKDGFGVVKIPAIFEKDDKKSMARFVGKAIQLLTDVCVTLEPDIILLLGDRGEMLAGAVVGVYLGIPVAQIHGGETTSTVDNLSRNAITKLAQIHLPATKLAAKTIIGMGEAANRVFVVGAPGLDDIKNNQAGLKKNISQKYSVDADKPIIIVIQHPVSEEVGCSASQMTQTMEAVKEIGFQSIVIYPNSDAGGRAMIAVIEKYRKYPHFHIFKNINRQDYLGLMDIASVIVGNSSSAIIEAPSLCLRAVNIGDRQKGRERAGNVTDVGYRKELIKKAILEAVAAKSDCKKTSEFQNPYGDGRTAQRIARILKTIKLDKTSQNKGIK